MLSNFDISDIIGFEALVRITEWIIVNKFLFADRVTQSLLLLVISLSHFELQMVIHLEVSLSLSLCKHSIVYLLCLLLRMLSIVCHVLWI